MGIGHPGATRPGRVRLGDRLGAHFCSVFAAKEIILRELCSTHIELEPVALPPCTHLTLSGQARPCSTLRLPTTLVAHRCASLAAHPMLG